MRHGEIQRTREPPTLRSGVGQRIGLPGPLAVERWTLGDGDVEEVVILPACARPELVQRVRNPDRLASEPAPQPTPLLPIEPLELDHGHAAIIDRAGLWGRRRHFGITYETRPTPWGSAHFR